MIRSRYTILLVILVLYLIPILVLHVMPTNNGWAIFSTGLVLGLLGSAILFFLMCQWEQSIPILESNAETDIAPDSEWHKKENQLMAEIALKNNDLQKANESHHQCQLHMTSAMEEFESFKNSATEQNKQKDLLIQECNRKLAEQTELLEKQKEQIQYLSEKESELNYEIKTLLKFAPTEDFDIYEEPFSEKEKEK